MARTRSLRTQWARHRVDHGTICGRGYANSGHHKPLCACVDNTFINPNSSGRRPENLEFAPRPGKIAMSWLTCSTRCGTSTARKVEGPLRDALRHEQSADGNPAPLTLRSAASIRTHANRDNMRLLCRMQRTYGLTLRSAPLVKTETPLKSSRPTKAPRIHHAGRRRGGVTRAGFAKTDDRAAYMLDSTIFAR
jgi:hypothetical protein